MAQNQVNFGIGFNVNKSGLDSIKYSLNSIKKLSSQDLLKVNNNAIKDLNEAEETLKQIKISASEIEDALKKAFNQNLGTLNISKFNEELGKLDLDNIYKSFSKAGSVGQSAFRGIATELLTTNTQLKQTHNFLDNMATTMANTVKWNIASSAMNHLTGSVQQAYGYIKSLDSSLNDIRIVTGASADQMAVFADKANTAAKALGKTTTDYTQASLIYYQQGLNEKEVEARTETTLKAANVTGQSADEVSEQLTAVWNGYKVSASEAELYVDKLAAVATATASDLEELSVGMSKVASAANAMGVDVDQLNAQLATIISVTRQAPESVGTALKTIYARMSDLELGGTDEDGLGLGDVSGQMEEMGIDVIDASGNLRDMGDVIEDVAARWSSWTEAEQTAMAQVMAGARQYNNLIALFDNWDMYTDALDTSTNAMGTLQNQQDVYMESTRAHLETMTASFEDLFDSLLDADAINSVIDGITIATDALSSFIDAIGGGSTVLTTLGSLGSKVFGKQIAQGIATSINNIENMKANASLIQSQIDLAEKLSTSEDADTKALSELKIQALSYANIMTEGQNEVFNAMLKTHNQLLDQKDAWIENAKAAEKFFNRISGEDKKIGLDSQKNDIREKIEISSDKTKEAIATGDLKTLEDYKINLNSIIDGIQDYRDQVNQLKQAQNEYATVINQVAAGSEAAFAAESDYKAQQEDFLAVMEAQNQLMRDTMANDAFSADMNIALTDAIRTYENALITSSGTITQEVEDAARNIINVSKQAADAGIQEAEKAENIIRQVADKIEQANVEAAQNSENAMKRFFKTLQNQKAIQGITNIIGGVSSLFSAYQSLSSFMSSAVQGNVSFADSFMSIGFAVTSAIDSFGSIQNGLITLKDALSKTSLAGSKFVSILKGVSGGPWGLIIAGATAAAGALLSYSKAKKEAEEQQRKENIEKGQEIAEEQQNIRDLQKAYQDALNTYQDTGEGKEALITATNNLSTALGLERAHVIDATNAWSDYSKEVLEARQAEAEKAKASLTTAKDSAGEDLALALRGTKTDSFKAVGDSITGSFGKYDKTSLEALTLRANLGDIATFEKAGDKMEQAYIKVENSGEGAYKVFTRVEAAMNQMIGTEMENSAAFEELQELYNKVADSAKTYKEAIDAVAKNALDIAVIEDTLNGQLVEPTNLDELEEYQNQIKGILKTLQDSGAISELFNDDDFTRMAADYTAGLSAELEALTQQQEAEATISAKINSEDRTEVEKYLETLDQTEVEVIIKTVWDGASIEDVKRIAEAANLDNEISKIQNTEKELNNLFNGLITGEIDALDATQQVLVQDLLKSLDNGAELIEEWGKATESGSMAQGEFLGKLITSGKLLEGLHEQQVELNKLNIENKQSELSTAESNLEKANQDLEKAKKAVKEANADATEEELEDLYKQNNAYVEAERNIYKYATASAQCTAELEKLNKESKELEVDTSAAIKADTIIQYSKALDQKQVNIKSAYDAAESGNVEGEEAAILDELETKYQNLKNAADEHGRTSKIYLDLLKEVQVAEFENAQNEREQNLITLNNLKKELEEKKAVLELEKQNLEAQLENATTEEDKNRIQNDIDDKNVKIASANIGLNAIDQAMIDVEQPDTSYLLGMADSIEDLNRLFQEGAINAETYNDKVADLFNLEPEALRKEIEILQELNPELEDNIEYLTEIAKTNLRVQKGAKNLAKSWDDYSDAVKDWIKNGKKVEDWNGDIVDSTGDVESAFKDLFDLTEDDFSMLPKNFVENHIDQLDDVVNNVDGAYENMQNLIADELMYKIVLDPESYTGGEAGSVPMEIMDMWNNLQTMLSGMDLTVGVAIDNANFLRSCNEMIWQSGMTQEAVQAAFANMGCDVEFTEDPAEIQDLANTGDYYVPATYAPGEPIPTGGESGSAEGAVKSAVVVEEGHFESAGSGTTETVKPGAFAIKTITPNGKSSGGNIARKAAPAGGSGGGGKKGGGGKGKTVKKPKARKKDYYHNVNNSLTKLGNQYDKLAEQQDKTFGQKHIDNIKKTNENLDKQIDKMRERIKIANEQEKKDLKKEITSNYKDVKFNKDGTIKNYENILAKYYKKYQNAKTQDAQDKAKEKYDELKELLDDYETLILETIPGWEAEIREKIDEKYENIVHQFEYEIEMRINFGESEREMNEFLKEFKAGISDIDFLGQVQFEEKQLNSFLNSKEVTSKTRQLQDAMGELNKINSALEKGYSITNESQEEYFSDVWGDNKAGLIEYIKTLQTDLMNNLQDMWDARQNAYDVYLDAIDDGIEKFDKHIEQYELINEEIEHNMNLIEMLYGETSNMMDAQYDLQEKNYLGEIQSLKQISEVYKTNWNEQKQKMAEMEAAGDTTSNAYKEAKEQAEIYEEAYNETISNLNSTVEEAVQNLIDKYAYGVNQVLNNMATKMFGEGLNVAMTQWSLLNEESEMYLDNINSAFEIQKLEYKYKEALNNTDSITAQKKLNEVMEDELSSLREKDKLSQYEVDRANLIYELTLKQIALEEAQQNKSKMRLRRNAQGNYSYQFTADTEQINQAQEDVTDVLQRLTNLSQEKGREIYDTALSATQNFVERMAEIEAMADGTEKDRLKQLTVDNYNRVMSDLMEQSELVENHINELVSGPLAEIMDAEKQLFVGDEGISTQILKLTKTLRDSVTGEGGITEITGKALEDITSKATEYKNSLEQIEKATGKAFKELSNEEYVKQIKDQIDDLTGATNGLASAWDTTLEKIKLVIEEMDKAITKNTEVQAALKALEDSEKVEQEETKTAGDTAEQSNKDVIQQPVSESEPVKTETEDKNNKASTSNKKGTGNGKVEVGDKVTINSSYAASKGGKYISNPKYKKGSKLYIQKISGSWVHIGTKKAMNSSTQVGWIKKKDISGYDTGGYTGNWNSKDGKLAFLHQKELVLNQKDTRNILDAVNIIRGLGGLLQNSMINRIESLTQSLSEISVPTIQSNPESGPQSIDQTVHITAEFPGATEAIQIEQALESLVNRASQYAFRTKE